MAKNSLTQVLQEPERLNLFIPPGLAVKLNAYCLKVANKRGKMPFGIKASIGKMAIEEWLKNHNNDVDIEF